MHCTHRFCAAHLSIAALTLTLSLPALAGDLVARAGQNPNYVEQISGEWFATAAWLTHPSQQAWEAPAHAFAYRHAIRFDAHGEGSTFTEHFNGFASNQSTYQIWDMSTDTALDPALARTLQLNFNFVVTLGAWVGETSLSATSTQYSAMLISGIGEARSGFVSATYGPTGLSIQGDSALYGVYNDTFVLRHAGADTGSLSMMVAGLAGNEAWASGALAFWDIDLVSPWAGGNLGIRFVENGQIIPITAVPEPGTYALLLAGLGVVAVCARRRKA